MCTLAVAGVVLSSAGAWSQSPPATRTEAQSAPSLRGKIIRVEGQNRVVVQMTDNKEVILISSPTTRYLIAGRAGRFSDLRPGVDVRATYILENNQYVVSAVDVGDGDSSPGGLVESRFRGKILTVNAAGNELVVQAPNGDRVTFYAQKNAQFTRNGRPVSFGDLIVGTPIEADFVMRDGKRVVSTVAIVTEPPVIPGAILAGKFRGKIVAVNGAGNQFVVRTPDDNLVTIHVQKTARFLRDGQAVRVVDVAIGAVIETDFVERDGRRWVEEVIIVPDNAGLPTPPVADANEVQGVVVRVVGQNQVIIRTNDNKEVTVELAPQTVYTFNNQPVQLSDIQAGQDLRIVYDTRDRRSIASRIFVVRRK